MAGVMSDAMGTSGALIASTLETYSDRARPAMESLQALASLSPVAAGAVAETGKAWFELMSRTAESRGRRSAELMRCFTPQQVAQVQAGYFGDAMHAWLDANARILDISVETYRGMVQPVERARGRMRDARKSA